MFVLLELDHHIRMCIFVYLHQYACQSFRIVLLSTASTYCDVAKSDDDDDDSVRPSSVTATVAAGQGGRRWYALISYCQLINVYHLYFCPHREFSINLFKPANVTEK